MNFIIKIFIVFLVSNTRILRFLIVWINGTNYIIQEPPLTEPFYSRNVRNEIHGYRVKDTKIFTSFSSFLKIHQCFEELEYPSAKTRHVLVLISCSFRELTVTTCFLSISFNILYRVLVVCREDLYEVFCFAFRKLCDSILK